MNGLKRDSNARDECQFDLRGIDFADKLHELQLDDNDLNTNVCVDWAMTKKRREAQLTVRLSDPTGDLFVDHAMEGVGLKDMGHQGILENEFIRFEFEYDAPVQQVVF